MGILFWVSIDLNSLGNAFRRKPWKVYANEK